MTWIMYDLEPHVAEIYDQIEPHTDDASLILNLIGVRGPLRILEPFCGTGRILIPLALQGHELVGLDRAEGMLAGARTKIAQLPAEVQRRISLFHADVLSEPWPQGFDVVVLGGNCFYELATPEEQEDCIAAAAASLKQDGYVYVDNNHMEGDLDRSWQDERIRERAFPTGTCADGTHLESSTQAIWWDAPRRLIRYRRITRFALPDGSSGEREYIVQTHPVSTVEVQAWIKAHGFQVERLFGDRAGNPYAEASGRAILWARRHCGGH